jgi:AcrR family transcriptional regulator
VPTGVALRDARQHLFAAAERVLLREGPSGLTSRSVTDEAGVAKGVLHRHFTDFDDFLAELIRDQITKVTARTAALHAMAGRDSVQANLAGALAQIFTPVALHMVALFTSRDRLRARLRETTPRGIPVLAEASAGLADYLQRECELGRIAAPTDATVLAFTLIGTAHMLFAGQVELSPDRQAINDMIESIIPDSRDSS